MNEEDKKFIDKLSQSKNHKEKLYNDRQLEYVYKCALTIVDGKSYDKLSNSRKNDLYGFILTILGNRELLTGSMYRMKMKLVELDDRSEYLMSIIEKMKSMYDDESDPFNWEYKKEGIPLLKISKREDIESLLKKLEQLGVAHARRWQGKTKTVKLKGRSEEKISDKERDEKMLTSVKGDIIDGSEEEMKLLGGPFTSGEVDYAYGITKGILKNVDDPQIMEPRLYYDAFIDQVKSILEIKSEWPDWAEKIKRGEPIKFEENNE